MQKLIAIILTFIFNFCLFATGAFGYADCASNCCCKPAMSLPEKASHTLDVSKITSLMMAPGCCSGSTITACEFTGGPAASLSEAFPATVRSEAPDLSGLGLTATNLHTETGLPKIYARGPDLWHNSISLPIYLQNLTFLC